MRFHTIIFALIVMSAASIENSDGFFIKHKEALSKLSSVKSNLVTDVKGAIGDLKQATHLKVKGITGGIKAIGKAKLGLLKGLKDAKIGLIKGIAKAKLAKVAAIKASKLAFAKTLVAGKIVPLVASAADGLQRHHEASGSLLLDKVVSSAAKAQNHFFNGAADSSHRQLAGIIFPHQSESAINTGEKNSGISTLLFRLFGNFLGNSGTTSNDSKRPVAVSSLIPADLTNILTDANNLNNRGNIALFPTPTSGNLPNTHINIITFKNQLLTPATSSSSSGSGYEDAILSFHKDPHHQQSNIYSTLSSSSSSSSLSSSSLATASNYGTPINTNGPSAPSTTSYGVPIIVRR